MTKKIQTEEIEISEETQKVMTQYPMLGKRVRDVITGLEGTVIVVLINLLGCNQIGISPQVDKDGKCESTVYIDEGRIKILGVSIRGKISKKSPAPGADFNPDAPTF